MGRIPEEIIERIKNENDIVDIIGEKVQLKKSGRNYMGLCPFHGEKSPSFSVNRDKQIYKCFGCGVGGNVFSFVMANENLSFIEAVKKLAVRANIEIPEDNIEYNKINNKRETLQNMNRDAGVFFYQNIKKNKKAYEYFIKRDIHPETITKFGLGYSLDSWDALLKHLKNKGYKDVDIKDSGLMGVSEKGKVYDRFRNRLMFPVFDYKGKVTGFGARVFDNSKPKYLNSPETLLFKKGTNLYGLNFALAKNNSIEDKTIIICEGYMDCIAMHQAGVTNSVATLGTALTPIQAKLLKRYADKVIVSFDADEAGMMATLRGLDILTKEGLEVSILRIPDGKDPDEFIKSHGKDTFVEILKDAQPLMRFKLNYAKQNLDLRLDEDRIKYFRNIKDIFKDMDPIQKDIYVGIVSDDINVSKEAIYEALDKNYEVKTSNQYSNYNRENENFRYENNKGSRQNISVNYNQGQNYNPNYNNSNNLGQNSSYNNYENNKNERQGNYNREYQGKVIKGNIRNKNANNNDPLSKSLAYIESGQIKAQRIILKLISEGYKDDNIVNEDDFATKVHKNIYNKLMNFNGDLETLSTYMISNIEDPKEHSEWAQIEAIEDIPDNIEKDIIMEDYANSLKKFNNKRRKEYLMKKLSLLEGEGNFEETLELAKELLELDNKI